MKNRYIIEKCPIRKSWVVFKRLTPHAMEEVYINKLKRECKKWVKKHENI